MTASVALPLRIGARQIGALRRRLVRVPVSLEQGLSRTVPPLPPLGREGHGYLITALPADRLDDVRRAAPALRPFVRQLYPRSYAALDMGYDTYFAGFSSKSRSTLKRKLRKFADAGSGTIDLRGYHTPDRTDEFHRLARAISATTYQEKRLATGLPDGAVALAEMRSRAANGAMRGWVLFLRDAPVSYLYAPAEGDTLIYAYLGYDPAHAALSPGTVLQLEAMRELMAERRFARFDFTEGDGQHKRQFATASLDCADLLLLRPTLPNLAAGFALNGFDAFVAGAKRVVGKLGLLRLARAIRR